MKTVKKVSKSEEFRWDRHPCFSEAAHMKWGRIHLPVAPLCNISCKYCLRRLNKTENRPGVAAKIISPEEAIKEIDKARKKFPITVAGIAGPGESLVNEETFQTFELVEKYHPDLLKCLSSNGLLLPDCIDRLRKLKVSAVTVTANSLRPETAEKIYNFVNFKGKTYKGKEAAELLIKHQIEGVKKAVKAGFILKINTVYIPGINSGEVEEIAKFYSGLGITIMNIIPLIPVHEMSKEKEPTCEELKVAREQCEPYIKQFKKCQQCRADAVGIPGIHGGGKRLADSEYFHG